MAHIRSQAIIKLISRTNQAGVKVLLLRLAHPPFIPMAIQVVATE
jgi:hypothetical protein